MSIVIGMSIGAVITQSVLAFFAGLVFAVMSGWEYRRVVEGRTWAGRRRKQRDAP